jgi:hypothetical protein
MTDDRSLERAARAWLELGPTQAPEQAIQAALHRIESIPQERAWPRLQKGLRLSRFAQVTVAIVTVVAVVLGGALLLQRRPELGPIAEPTPSGSPSVSPSAAPSVSPSAAPSPTGVVVPPLNTEFHSPRYGYAIWYPDRWTARPASEPWVFGSTVSWGASTVDDLHGPDVRLSAASQKLTAGETAAGRLQTMIDASPVCEPRRPALPTVSVGGLPGTVAVNGCSTRTGFNGGISPQGYVYAVVLVYENRAYEFILDGNVDPYFLGELLASVTFEPASAADLTPSS